MPVSLNTNLLALNTARNLQGSYGRLAASVERLSSGLRVNSADDDAAGLAIRELMRADIAALRQGVRNANDAISMIQVADGALGIIDEKLIRMKELAEQAATGTYDSTQRLMIDSEFKAMADEIDRIARAPDFNGIKLLDGSREGQHDGSALDATGKLKIHFGSGNDSAEDYYYVEIGDCTLSGLGLREYENSSIDIDMDGSIPITFTTQSQSIANTKATAPQVNDYGNISPIYMTDGHIAQIQDIVSSQGTWYSTNSPITNPSNGGGQNFMFIIPKGAKNILINMTSVSDVNKLGDNDIQLFTKNGIHLAGTQLDDYVYGTMLDIDNSIDAQSKMLGFSSADYNGANLNSGPQNYDPTGVTLNYSQYNGMNIGYSGDADRYDANPNDGFLDTWRDYEILTIDEATEDLIVWMPGGAACSFKAYWDPASVPIPKPIDSFADATASGKTPPKPTGEVISIDTQDKAQAALERIDKSITIKDKVRAHLGALQNRLENTVTNLTIQAENLQAAESRISDADVGLEMMLFVRNQILTQAGVAMLSQANSLPQMMVGLLSR